MQDAGWEESPKVLLWEITHACNFQCLHCYMKGGKNYPELSTNECLRVVDDLASIGTEVIALGGGEPLLRKDIYAIIKYAVDSELEIHLVSNGYHLNLKTIKMLISSGLSSISISVDGAKPETHEAIRGVKGSFDRAISAAKKSVRLQLPVTISTCVTKLNYDEITEIIRMAQTLQVTNLHLIRFVPIGYGALHSHKLSLSSDNLYKLYRQVKHFSSSLSIEFTDPVAFAARSQDGENVTSTGCTAGLCDICLSPTGELHPCPLLRISLGNIRNKSIKEVWRQSQVLQELRNRKSFKSPCGECCYNSVCGGCRASAYAIYGNYKAGDPGCWLPNITPTCEILQNKR